MRELLSIAATMAVALGVIAVAVGPGHDTRTMISSPEVVSEDFVRNLATGRYDRAVDNLEEQDGAEATLTVQGEALRRRAGEVHQVEGEEGAIDGDTATASTRITTSNAGVLEWTFSLLRREGTWKITDWTIDSPRPFPVQPEAAASP